MSVWFPPGSLVSSHLPRTEQGGLTTLLSLGVNVCLHDDVLDSCPGLGLGLGYCNPGLDKGVAEDK